MCIYIYTHARSHIYIYIQYTVYICYIYIYIHLHYTYICIWYIHICNVYTPVTSFCLPYLVGDVGELPAVSFFFHEEKSWFHGSVRTAQKIRKFSWNSYLTSWDEARQLVKMGSCTCRIYSHLDGKMMENTHPFKPRRLILLRFQSLSQVQTFFPSSCCRRP